jgi:hypothetical protein
MKKKLARKTSKVTARPVRKTEKRGVLFLIKSWMFVVMFALMLGVGAIVGTYIAEQMNAATPAVAGVSIEAE